MIPSHLRGLLRPARRTPLEPELVQILTGRVPAGLSATAVDQALEYELAELVAPHIQSGIETTAPMERQAAVVALAARADARRKQMDAALEAVAERLSAIGDRAMVFKGPAAARALYDTPSERAFNDIDLFLDPSRPGDELAATLDALGVERRRSEALVELAGAGRPVHEFTAYVEGVMVDVHFNPFGLVSPVEDGAALAGQFVEAGAFHAPSAELGLLITLLNLTRKGGGALWLVADALRYLDGRGGPLTLEQVYRLADQECVVGIAERAVHRLALLQADAEQAAEPALRSFAIPEPETAGRAFRQSRTVLQRERSAAARSATALLRWINPGELERLARGI